MISAEKARHYTKDYWTKKVSGTEAEDAIKKILFILEFRIEVASKGGLTQIREIVNLPHDEELWKVSKELIANPIKEKLVKKGFQVIMDCFITEENGVIGFEIDW